MAIPASANGMLALLALVPLTIYTLDTTPELAAVLITGFNVCLITAALWVSFGPDTGESTHATSPAS